MKRLIDTIIKKWFCCHEWKEVDRVLVTDEDDWGNTSEYSVTHYVCTKCGRFKKVKSH